VFLYCLYVWGQYDLHVASHNSLSIWIQKRQPRLLIHVLCLCSRCIAWYFSSPVDPVASRLQRHAERLFVFLFFSSDDGFSLQSGADLILKIIRMIKVIGLVLFLLHPLPSWLLHPPSLTSFRIRLLAA